MLYLRVDQEVKRRIQELSNETGLTLNVVASRLLRRALELPTKEELLIERLGPLDKAVTGMEAMLTAYYWMTHPDEFKAMSDRVREMLHNAQSKEDSAKT